MPTKRDDAEAVARRWLHQLVITGHTVCPCELCVAVVAKLLRARDRRAVRSVQSAVNLACANPNRARPADEPRRRSQAYYTGVIDGARYVRDAILGTGTTPRRKKP